MISFAPAPPPEDAAPAPLRIVSFPPGVKLDLQLKAPIDEERSRAGDRIEAVVKQNVKRDGRVLVPKGALASGRIVRLEQPSGERDSHTVALQFDTLEFDGARANFEAEFAGFGTVFPPGVRVSVVRPAEARPGACEFRLGRRAGRIQVPRGTVFSWRTRTYR